MKAKNIPRMPRDMAPNCKKWWRRILKAMDTSLLMPCDVFCLEMCCMSLAVYERMKKDMRLRPDIYKGRNEDKEILSRWEEILSEGFDKLLLDTKARDTLMAYMP